jgi:hypothetical protein
MPPTCSVLIECSVLRGHRFHLPLQVGVGLVSAAGIIIKVPMLTQVFHVLGLGYESHPSPAPHVLQNMWHQTRRKVNRYSAIEAYRL